MNPTGGIPRAISRRLRKPVACLSLIGTLTLQLTGCEKKTPPDPHMEQGLRLLSEDPKAAYDELEKARDSSHPDVLVGRGLALERLRKYEEAEKVLLAAQKIAPNNEVTLFALGRVKIMLGKPDEARPLVEKLVAQSPTDLAAVLLLVCLAHQESLARAAMVHLESWKQLAEKSKSGAIPAEYYLARMSLAQQLKTPAPFEEAKAHVASAKLTDQEGALSLVQLALKSGRTDLGALLLRKLGDVTFSAEEKFRIAELAHGLGDHALVGKLLAELPSVSGQERKLRTLRAEHYFITGKPGAEVLLRKALSTNTEEGTLLRLQLMLAEALLRSGDIEQARKETEQLQKQHPNMQTALLLRTARLRIATEMEAQNPKEALRIAEEVAGLAPKDVGMRLLLAEAARQANGNAAGIASLRASIAEIPEDAPLRLALVQALEKSNDKKQALAELEQAHKKLGDVPMITATLALRLSQSGRAAEAAALYEKLLAGAQGNPIALNNLAMLYIEDLDQIDRGVELAEQAHALSPQPAIVDTLGWALFQRGSAEDKTRARVLLTSVRAQLSSPTFKYHLGTVLIATGEKTEGKALLQEALAQPEGFAEAEAARRLLTSQP